MLIQRMLSGDTHSEPVEVEAEEAEFSEIKSLVDAGATQETLSPAKTSRPPKTARARPAARQRPAARPAKPINNSGEFLRRTYVGDGGTLDYKCYVPASLADRPPLVVMLHGCSQSPDDFARGTGMNRLADELGCVVAYPAQTSSANGAKCWNWFRPGDQQRDRGEPALIAGITREAMAEHECHRQRIYVAGLSAGGATAAIMAANYPDLYAAVGIHSGLAFGAARNLPSAMMAMRRAGGSLGRSAGKRTSTGPAGFVPVITFHGDRDTTVHGDNSEEIVANASAAAGVPLRIEEESGVSEGGRRFTRSMRIDEGGNILVEQWSIHGSGHAWSGGDNSGFYTDPSGPDASRAMMDFFLRHETPLD